MKSGIKIALLAATLAAFAKLVLAERAPGPQVHCVKPKVQPDRKHQPKPIARTEPKRKRPVGEASSLERKEVGFNPDDTREDNRGRVASSKRSAKLKTSQLKTGQSKTGQRITRQPSKIKTTKTTPRKPTPTIQPESKTTHEIRLKPNHARMF